MLTYVVWDYLVILLAIALAQRYHHVITYCAAVMVIGARQAGIASVALHDGAHHLLLRNRRSNDLFAKAILYSVLAPVVGVRLESYRERHLAHHLNVNTSDDPDYPVFREWYESSRLRMGFLYAQTLLGIGFLSHGFLCFRRLSAIPRALEFLCIAALICGLVLNVRAAELFVLYWVIPLATWGFFVNFLRSSAEHSTPGSLRDDADLPAIFRTGEIVNSLFDSLFVATRGVNYHLAHHLFPSVPFYRLKQLQRDLSAVEEYRRYSHVTYGYHRYLIEFFSRRTA
jgi:fatty acid desaturase